MVSALPELLPGKRERERLGGSPDWEALGGGRSPHALAGKTPHSFVGPAQGRWDSWLSGDPGGPPLCTPGEGGLAPTPKLGAGKFSVRPLPELNSSFPCSVPHPEVIAGPHPSQTPLEGRPPCCLGTTPDLPLLGGIHTPHPRFGMEPGQGSPDVSGAGRGGCGRKNGKDRALPRREEQDPGKPFLGMFFQAVPISNTLFFFFFQEPPPAVPQQNPRVSLVSLRCFPLAPGRLSSADSPFSQLLLLLLFPTLAVIKKINFSPPRRLQLSPQGRVPLSMTFPRSDSTPTGQGALPRKRLGKTKIQGKKKNTCQGPVAAGEGSGSPRAKIQQDLPPKMPKELQNHLKAKCPTARGGWGFLGILVENENVIG